MSLKPLQNVRVVDLGCYIAGPLTGMLLADQGADVIKIDPKSGSLFDHPVNTIVTRNKSHIALDLKDEADLRSAEELIQSADILIENFGPGVMQRLGLSGARLHALNPGLITVSLPGFSDAGQFAPGAKAYEGIIAAATGQYTDIHAVRQLFGLDPVFTALPMASVYAAVHAATAAVLALRERRSGGPGVNIRAPLDAAAVSAMSSIYMKIESEPERYQAPRLSGPLKRLGLPLIRRWARTGEAAQTKIMSIARKAYPALMTSYACADGRLLYIFAIDNLKLATNALRALGLYDEVLAEGLVLLDPYDSGDRRDNLAETSNLSRHWQERLKTKIGSVLRTQPAAVWETRLQKEGVPCAVQHTTQEWLALPELSAAGIVTEVVDDQGKATTQPGVQVWLSDTPPDLARPAPARYHAPGWERSPPTIDQSTLQAERPPAQWLDGLTVIDMCSMVAGPVAGRTLAEYGARVIKIDAPNPNHGPRMSCWYGLDVNQGKESLLLDLKTAEGREVADRLLERADILLTNHSDAAMEGLGLAEARLRNDYPQLIFARIGAYNGPLKGPWSQLNGYDPVLQAASGIMTRYGDTGQPELHAIASCVDALTGYSAMFGIALALHTRDQVNQGRTVDASLAASATLIQLPFATSATTNLTEASGQTAKGEAPAYRLYRARDAWVFVAGRPEQLDDLADALGVRRTGSDQLEGLIERVVRSRRSEDCITRLIEAGLSAARVNCVDALRPILEKEQEGQRLTLARRDVARLGPVVSAPPQQIQTGAGGLRLLSVTEKPGASTRRIIEEFGFSSRAILKSGAASEELCHEYLPS